MTDVTKTTQDAILPPRKPKKQRPAPCYVPNVVPLIDVLFMLLLFFLLSTKFRQEEGDIPGSLPPSVGTDQPAGPELKQIEIIVRPVGGDDRRTSAIYEIKGNSLEMRTGAELFAGLQRMQKSGSKPDETPVYISPTRDVRWAFVVEAFNQAVRARFKTIGFMPPG